MKSTIEDIKAFLETKEAEKITKEKKWSAQIEDARKTAERLKAELIESANTDDYKRILREQSENEQLLSFLENNKTVNTAAITEEEYKQNCEKLDKMIDDIQVQYALLIEKEAEKLTTILLEYCEKVDMIDSVRNKNVYMRKGNVTKNFSRNGIMEKFTDPLFYCRHYTREFFKHRRTIEGMTTMIIRDFKNPWLSAEENSILAELKKRMKVARK